MRAVAEVERARELYALRAWSDAHAALSAADRNEPLGAGDLARLATAAYMIGRQEGGLMPAVTPLPPAATRFGPVPADRASSRTTDGRPEAAVVAQGPGGAGAT